jgi:putative ABC transport system permease protein
VLLFTIATSTVAGLLFGSMPAWQATRLDLNEVLKLGGRTGTGGGRRSPRRLLVIAEFAMALTLLACGGLALRSFWNLTRIDLGIRTDHLLSFRLTVPEQRLKGPDQIRAYYRQMLEKIQAVPGIRNVAAMTGTPAGGTGMGTRFAIAGRPAANPAERPGASFQTVTSGYVDARLMSTTPRPACASPSLTNCLSADFSAGSSRSASES